MVQEENSVFVMKILRSVIGALVGVLFSVVMLGLIAILI
jgi:hypothetical protein